jgi:glycosyltransferase involved in cell wall biosynthesis
MKNLPTRKFSTSPYKISIIILTKNAGNLFQEVLTSLFACTGINETEIILIDSGSQDLTLDYAACYPQIRVHQISPGDFGHGRTRNFGAKLAKGDILVFLVQDATIATPDFLTRLVAPLANTQVAAVYGRQLPRASANPVERFFLTNTYPDLVQTKAYDPSNRLSIQSIFFSNVCSAIRRHVWERVPFDEHLIMSEDQQWSKKVLQLGYTILYEPAATVLHSHNYGLTKVFQRNFDSGCSLRGVAKDSLAHMASYELNFLLVGIRQLALWGCSSHIPYFLLHEAARSLGFALGQQSHLLPVRLNRRLSLHKYFWRPQAC